jgi:hypothetical protein
MSELKKVPKILFDPAGPLLKFPPLAQAFFPKFEELPFDSG